VSNLATAREHGWEPTPDNILIGMHACIAPTDDEAAALARSRPRHTSRTCLLAAVRQAQGIVLRETRFHRDAENRGPAGLRRLTAPRGTDTGGVDRGVGRHCAGAPRPSSRRSTSAARARARDLQLHDEGRADPRRGRHRGMELFRDRVLPHVRHLGADQRAVVPPSIGITAPVT